MTQRELEELVLKVDEAFEVGSGPYISTKLRTGGHVMVREVALLAAGHEGAAIRQKVSQAAERIRARRREQERSDREVLYVSNGYLSDYGVPS